MFAVNIMRPGPWSNPFRIGPDGTRAYVSSEHGGSVAVVDVAKNEVVQTIMLPPASLPMGLPSLNAPADLVCAVAARPRRGHRRGH